MERGWEGGEYRIRIRGRVAEAEVFKPTLVVERTIATGLGSRAIEVADRVTNVGFETSPAMLLYHCNLGWPLLGPESRLWVNTASVKPVTEHAAKALAKHREMLPPTAGFEEMVYTMDAKADGDGLCRVALVNPSLAGGVGLAIEWAKATMPYVMEWKMMGEGVYVLGIEPANCPFPPCAKLRERGEMPTLKAGESFESGVTFRVCLGAEELADLEKAIGAAD